MKSTRHPTLPGTGRLARTLPSTGATTAGRAHQRRSGFTLLELLIVIGIMAMIGALVAPSLKRMKRVDIMSSANRQMLDDLAEARRKAIANRATVYVVFMPPATDLPKNYSQLDPSSTTMVLANQQTAYAMFTRHSAGDQPGTEYPRYLRGWKTLPEGVFIPAWKFGSTDVAVGANTVKHFSYTVANAPGNNRPFPVPTVESPVREWEMPYIAFDYQGRLCRARRAAVSGRPVHPVGHGHGGARYRRQSKSGLGTSHGAGRSPGQFDEQLQSHPHRLAHRASHAGTT